MMEDEPTASPWAGDPNPPANLSAAIDTAPSEHHMPLDRACGLPKQGGVARLGTRTNSLNSPNLKPISKPPRAVMESSGFEFHGVVPVAGETVTIIEAA